MGAAPCCCLDVNTVPGIVEDPSQVPDLITGGWLDIAGRIHLTDRDRQAGW